MSLNNSNPIENYKKYKQIFDSQNKKTEPNNPNLFLKILTSDNKEITQSENKNYINIALFSTNVGTTKPLNETNGLLSSGSPTTVGNITIFIPNGNEPCSLGILKGFEQKNLSTFTIIVNEGLPNQDSDALFTFNKSKITNFFNSEEGIIMEFIGESVLMNKDKKNSIVNNQGVNDIEKILLS